jgi:signal transduction histidine kinase
MAVAQPVAGTPLGFAAEFPEAEVLAPSRALLWRFLLIGGLVIGAGILLAWMLIGRVTGPLASLTAAAEAISAGRDPPGPAMRPRDDEIGRLDEAFRAMARSVRLGRENLEQQVAERTRALEEAQDSLVRKERLAVLGQLASSVSHELRNPLGVMSNVVYYLDHSLAGSSPRVRERLALLGEQIRLAEKIVADILDFTRSRPPDVSRVELGPFLEEQVGRVVLPDGIVIERAYNGGLGAARVDRVQIGQVMFNLLTNAVQAMDGRGGAVTLRCSADDGRVRVEVEDDGPGVPPELRSRIFEPLFTTKARGFGLGLSVARSLAEANGGRLDVTTATDGGARFVLDLPAAREAT